MAHPFGKKLSFLCWLFDSSTRNHTYRKEPVTVDGILQEEDESATYRDAYLLISDLIFRSRGQVTSSAILTDDPGKAVVAAPLLRIRVKSNFVIPEYLNWFINQEPAQALLASCAEGTALKMINKQALENLDVFIPPIARQRTIITVATYEEEEQFLIKKIASKRRQYIASTLMKLAKGE
ncbi:restriction endonuclease subunit S [Desulforamulus profundi]|uniref:Restriction endonuclease subunit S n=1 Tax=Desulforamulus profundi TaxID=1383067 RepID=A0A2C6M909_9FIRM|nr:restriction endonuclease subunit S [Desulforamulus profundi]PHJ37609.1 restriction endonuclease subunit S [Desulforamulus profundi]